MGGETRRASNSNGNRTRLSGGDRRTSRTRSPEPRINELVSPAGFDYYCAQCGYLNWLYGPEDQELRDHINSGHSYLDGTADIPSLDYTCTSAYINENQPAN